MRQSIQPPARKISVAVGEFVRRARDTMGIEVVAGAAGLEQRRITEAAMNRPGLVLAGFTEHFAPRRMQIIGRAEHAYLSGLSPATCAERLRLFFSLHVPCLVLPRGRRALPEIARLAEEFSIPVLRSTMITKDFINAATLLMENMTALRTQAYGTMVEIWGMGVLIEGDPGVGKSETALGLIKRGHALVADDITVFRRDSTGRVLGSSKEVTRFYMEIRGLGIVFLPGIYGIASVRGEKRLDMVVHLASADAVIDEDRSGQTRLKKEMLGEAFPLFTIRVKPGKDLVNVLETAALDQKLRGFGYDGAQALDQRLIEALTKGGK